MTLRQIGAIAVYILVVFFIGVAMALMENRNRGRK